MALKNPNFYNQASSKLLGWEPSWFNGCKEFDERLFEEIKKFQKENGLTPDGLCGPITTKMINNDYQMKLELWKVQQENKEKKLEKKSYIIYGDEQIEYPFPSWAFVGLKDKNALVASPSHYRSRSGRDIKSIVIHHDCCLNSKDCFKVLERRGLSIHFMIDYDGTIFQSVDLEHSAQHAGTANKFSIGIEINNPISLQYQTYYTSKKLEPRPIIKEWVSNGKKYKKFLGYYDVQVTALKQLVKTLCSGLGIPKEVAPTHNFYEPSLKGEFEGICAHYHVDPKKSKWDAGGLWLEDIFKEE